MHEFARLWHILFADKKFADPRAPGLWSSVMALAGMYPELIRIQSGNQPYSHCPFGQGDSRALPCVMKNGVLTDTAQGVVIGVGLAEKEGAIYLDWMDFFDIPAPDLEALLEELQKVRMDPKMFSWSLADWNDTVQLRATEDGQYARPHGVRGTNPLSAFLGAFYPALCDQTRRSMRKRIRDRFKQLCHECEEKRLGPRINDHER